MTQKFDISKLQKFVGMPLPEPERREYQNCITMYDAADIFRAYIKLNRLINHSWYLEHKMGKSMARHYRERNVKKLQVMDENWPVLAEVYREFLKEKGDY